MDKTPDAAALPPGGKRAPGCPPPHELSTRGPVGIRSKRFVRTPVVENTFPFPADKLYLELLRLTDTFNDKKANIQSDAEVEELLLEFTIGHFGKFTVAAYEYAAGTDLWTAHRFESECRRYLQRVAAASDLTSNSRVGSESYIRDTVQAKIEQSEEWKSYRQFLAKLAAKAQALPNEFQRRTEEAKRLFKSTLLEGKTLAEAKLVALRFYEFSPEYELDTHEHFAGTEAGERRAPLSPAENQDQKENLKGLGRWFAKLEASFDLARAPGGICELQLGEQTVALLVLASVITAHEIQQLSDYGLSQKLGLLPDAATIAEIRDAVNRWAAMGNTPQPERQEPTANFGDSPQLRRATEVSLTELLKQQDAALRSRSDKDSLRLKAYYDLADLASCAIRDGYDPDFISDCYKAIGSAGRDLGCPINGKAVEFWICKLAGDLHDNPHRLIREDRVGDTFGMIQCLLGASKRYYSRLMGRFGYATTEVPQQGEEASVPPATAAESIYLGALDQAAQERRTKDGPSIAAGADLTDTAKSVSQSYKIAFERFRQSEYPLIKAFDDRSAQDLRQDQAATSEGKGDSAPITQRAVAGASSSGAPVSAFTAPWDSTALPKEAPVSQGGDHSRETVFADTALPEREALQTRQFIRAQLQAPASFRNKVFADFAGVTEDQLKHWWGRRKMHADGGDVDKKIRLAAELWQRREG